MIVVKSPDEIETMRQGGRILATVLGKLREAVSPGMRTREFDEIVEGELKHWGARASFKGYRGFPANLCVSVNDEVVHGLPGDRRIEEGDIVSFDVGVLFGGLHTDAAVTVKVGEVDEEKERLLAVTEASLKVGIAQARCGAHVGDISAAIEDYVESHGFAAVREYTGHGVGRELHEEPQVPNIVFSRGPALRKGMTLAIEPMVNAGDWRTLVDDNNWTVRTADGRPSAHFEHTIVITDGQAEVLT
ncbi:MAG: type I methionyl aminopeptidase [Chloroflexota bacterium]